MLSSVINLIIHHLYSSQYTGTSMVMQDFYLCVSVKKHIVCCFQKKIHEWLKMNTLCITKLPDFLLKKSAKT